MVVEVFESVNKLLKDITKSFRDIKNGRGILAGEECLKPIARDILRKVNVKMSGRKHTIALYKLKGTFPFSLDFFDAREKKKLSKKVAKLVFLLSREGSHQVTDLVEKKPGRFVAYAKLFSKPNAVGVSLTDKSDGTKPRFESEVAFSHNGNAFDGKLITAMLALVERTTGKSVGEIFASGTTDFAVPKEIFKKLNSLFLCVGENVFCHRCLLFFSVYIIEKILSRLSRSG